MTNNSWQPYVDNNMVGTGKISQGLIVGNTDGTIWAGNISATPSELKILVNAFSDASTIRTGGIVLGGVKYILISGDGRSIYGRKGDGGIVAVKTKQAVLIGMYASGMVAGDAVKVIESLADYLISVQY